MAKTPKVDGVIETVHYNPEGKIKWVRAYLRSGFVFNDVTLLDRETLVHRLQEGARFYTGRRIPFQGNKFELEYPLRLESHNGSERIVAGDSPSKEGDSLASVQPF